MKKISFSLITLISRLFHSNMFLKLSGELNSHQTWKLANRKRNCNMLSLMVILKNSLHKTKRSKNVFASTGSKNCFAGIIKLRLPFSISLILEVFGGNFVAVIIARDPHSE